MLLGGANPVLEIAALIPRQLNLVQLFHRLFNLILGQFTRSENDQLLPHLAGDVEKPPVIGEALRVPGDQRQAFEASGIAVKYRKPTVLKVFEDFVFQRFEIEIRGGPAFASSE